MVSVNRSFFCGICFASITWIISLYLVYELHRIDVKNIKNPLSSTALSKIKNSDDIIHKLQPVPQKHTAEVEEQGLSSLGMVKTTEDKRVRDEGYHLHAFNTLVSNQLGLHRSIPDTRNKLCQEVKYPQDLPTSSVIICFYNEHFNTLLRSIYSVIQRTPEHLLHEIILIDDFSDVKDLHTNLTRYIDQNLSNKVKLLLNDKREGLIRSRVIASRKAKGDVLIFLDSHIEVNVGWIQPLLYRIQENRTRVVMPIIDIINADTFAYSASPLVRGGFNWGLHFKWDNLPVGTLAKDEDFIKPIKSPTMAGGLFAMNRKYFVEMGEYDEGMDIWGGENLEISFRVWMCGGSLELAPCSRVGHVFRQRRPYGDPTGQDSMTRNSLRVANVWMDEYKTHYIARLGKGAVSASYGDISSRRQLRTSLNCQSFAWYMRTVYPELSIPGAEGKVRVPGAKGGGGGAAPALEPVAWQPWHSRKRLYRRHGQIRLEGSGLCIQGDQSKRGKASWLELQKCQRKKNQVWWESSLGELVLAQLLCLQAGQPPHLHKCHEMGGDQQWQHKGENKTPIYNMAAGTCLGVDKPAIGATVDLKLCTNSTYSSWDIIESTK